MKKKPTIACFDFDGTLIPFDAFIPFLSFAKGRWKTWGHLLLLAPEFLFYLIGTRTRQELKEAIMHRLMKGDSYELLEGKAKIYAEEKLKPALKKSMLEKVEWHKKQGHQLIINSANLNIIVEPIKKMLKFDECLSSNVEIDEWGVITGFLEGKNCRGPEKVKRLEKLLGPLDDYTLYVYGDSAGDKELLKIANHPFKV